MVDGTFSVIGGDKRCAYVAQLLIQEQCNVKTAGLELSGVVDASHLHTLDEALQSDFIILPLPLLDKNGQIPNEYTATPLNIFEILNDIPPDSMIFAGRVSAPVAVFARENGKALYDYYLREELQLMNAIPTAEGTIETLMRKLPITIFGARILVTGFGRTAQALCLLLKAMGAKVTVAARRREALTQARILGLRAMPIAHMTSETLPFDAIINTVPAQVITAAVLELVGDDCFILDIASAPGGVDVGYAVARGMACETALSLPGKVAPKTSGRIIKDTILNIIEERGCGH